MGPNDGGQTLRAWTWDWFGQRKKCMILALAKVLRAEEFRQADDLPTVTCRVTDKVGRVIKILRGRCYAGHLN